MSTEDIQDEPYEHEEPQPWRFTIWHSIGLMLLFGFLQAWIYTGLSKLLHLDLKDMTWMHFVLMNGISGAITIWAGSVLNSYSISEVLASGRVGSATALSAVLMIVGVVILSQEFINVLQWIMPLPDEVDIGTKLMTQNLYGVLLMVAAVAPITEELIFRGLILDGLRRTYSIRTAMFVSALLFALVHDHPYVMINAFVLGLLFALIRLRTGSLLLCIVIHGIYNALPFLISRVASIEIPGFTSFPAEGIQFQPIWFDALGVVLTALGLAGLRFAPRPE